MGHICSLAVEPSIVVTTRRRYRSRGDRGLPWAMISSPCFQTSIAAQRRHADVSFRCFGWRIRAYRIICRRDVRPRTWCATPDTPICSKKRLSCFEPDWKANRVHCLENGVHLIVVQSADGSLVVGDSHHYGPHTRPLLAGRQLRIELILERVLFKVFCGLRAACRCWSGGPALTPRRANKTVVIDNPHAWCSCWRYGHDRRRAPRYRIWPSEKRSCR